MTLNEAIEHLDETLGDSSRTWSCEECRQEHIQLREWLIELKGLRKAQKPVLDDTGVYHCADCEHPVGYKNCEGVLFPHCFYCPKCGRAVKWE